MVTGRRGWRTLGGHFKWTLLLILGILRFVWGGFPLIKTIISHGVSACKPQWSGRHKFVSA
jgi:hypothetical protein